MFKQSEGNPHNQLSVHMLSFKRYVLIHVPHTSCVGLQNWGCRPPYLCQTQRIQKWVNDNSQTDQKVQALLPALSSCRDLWKMFPSFLCIYFHGKLPIGFVLFSIFGLIYLRLTKAQIWLLSKSTKYPQISALLLVPQTAPVFDEEVIRELKSNLTEIPRWWSY